MLRATGFRRERRPRVDRLAPGIIRIVSIMFIPRVFIPRVPPPTRKLKSGRAAYRLARCMAKASDRQPSPAAGALPIGRIRRS